MSPRLTVERLIASVSRLLGRTGPQPPFEQDKRPIADAWQNVAGRLAVVSGFRRRLSFRPHVPVSRATNRPERFSWPVAVGPPAAAGRPVAASSLVRQHPFVLVGKLVVTAVPLVALELKRNARPVFALSFAAPAA